MRLALVASLLVLVASVARAQVCAPDEALDRAARALLSEPARPTPAALLDAARSAGSDAPVLDSILIRDGDAARRDRFLARVRARRGPSVACGEAREGDRWLVLAAPRAGHIELAPDGTVRVELDPSLREARLYVQDAEGRIWQSSVRPSEPIALPSDLEAPLRVQLVAEDGDGPRPIAERTIGDGTVRVVIGSDRPIGERLASLRESEGLGALRDNRLLERVALAHAEGVCRERRVSHVTEDGDPEDRLAQAGLRARHVGEAIARAEDAARAYAALLRSPSHRAALTDRRFTDVGVGHAGDGRGGTCLVVLLAAWPRPVPR